MILSGDEMFAEQARRTPDFIAAADRGTTLSYRALDEAAMLLARRLGAEIAREIGPVCVFSDKGVAMVVAMLGVFRARGVYVPLDPAEPDLRIASLLDRVRPAAVLVSEALHARIRSICADLPGQKPLCAVIGPAGEVLSVEQGEPAPAPFRHEPAVAGLTGRPAYIFFTSGSTGTPKAIVGSDRSLAHFLAWERQAFSVVPADRFSQLGAVSSDASLKDILVPLTSGASVWIPPPQSRAGRGLADWAGRTGISVLGAVPTLFRTLLEAIEEDPAVATRLAQRLRLVLLAGEPLRASWVNRWMDAFGARVPLANLYGATEATVFSVFNIISERPAAGSVSVPCGRAMRGTEILVLNRAGRPCGVGELGEIHLRTDYLSLGYLGDDEATRRSFWTDADGRLAYRTGDLGRLRGDGLLDFHGRADAQLKIRGTRVEPGEIESLIISQPGVREAVVTAAPDVAGDLQLVAHLLRHGEMEPDVRAIRQNLARRLPPALMPSHITVHSSFPQTHTGKIDRGRLARAPHFETAPVAAQLTREEEALAGVWAKLLDRPPSGPGDNFFELGGHSLVAMQLQSRVDSAFGVRLALTDIFEAPSLADMAARIAHLRVRSRPEAPASAPASPSQLSTGQQRLWFLNELHPQSGVYNLHAAYRIRGPLRIDLLGKAMSDLLERHEILRGTFSVENGSPKVTVQPALTSRIAVSDLSGLETDAREATAIRVVTEEVSRPFDLATGPLLRVALIRLNPDDHMATMTLHHICGDMWSCAILARDLSALYAARLAGAAPDLPVLRLGYGDHVRTEAAQLEGPAYARLRTYWTTALTGAPASNGLPHDVPPAGPRKFRGGHVENRLSAELTREVGELAREHRATLFMVLLSAFAIVLRHHNGSDDIVIGTDVDGRNSAHAENVVGFFVNQLVMRCDLSGNPSFGEVLSRVRTMSLEAYDHRAMPFDRLVQLCNPRRDRVAPIFTVKLVAQTAPLPMLSLPDVEVTRLDVRRETAQIDLNLRCFPTGHTTLLSAEYDADLFRRSTIERVLDKFQMLMERAVRDTTLRIDELDRMFEAHDLRVWAASARAPPRRSAARVSEDEERR